MQKLYINQLYSTNVINFSELKYIKNHITLYLRPINYLKETPKYQYP